MIDLILKNNVILFVLLLGIVYVIYRFGIIKLPENIIANTIIKIIYYMTVFSYFVANLTTMAVPKYIPDHISSLFSNKEPGVVDADTYTPIQNTNNCTFTKLVKSHAHNGAMTIEKNNLLRCLSSSDNCKIASAGICQQTELKINIAYCSKKIGFKLNDDDRRVIASIYEQRGCFVDALPWVAGSTKEEVKFSLNRWKNKICDAGAESILSRVDTTKTLRYFGVFEPSINPEIVKWSDCTKI